MCHGTGESTIVHYLAWKQAWTISLSNDFLFSHQTQCLLSTGHFIATILDGQGKRKQFSWSEVTRQWINAPAASWWNCYLHSEITSKVQALSSHINLTNWKNKLGSFRQEFKLPFYTSITHTSISSLNYSGKPLLLTFVVLPTLMRL